MKNELSDFTTRPGLTATPQSEQAHPDQVANSAGGFSFQVDEWDRLLRFLILGTTGGSYYATAKKLTEDNAKNLLALIEKDPARYIQTIVAVSEAGRAPKNDQALFALALATGAADVNTRRAAFSALPLVARTATHLFQFVGFMQNHRGWGKQARRGVAAWYEGKDASKLAYQAVKYQQRDGWSHWDVLRLSHPRATTEDHALVYDFIRGKLDLDQLTVRSDATADQLALFSKLRANPTPDEVVDIAKTGRMPWEVFLSEQRTPAVWRELLRSKAIPLGALVRQLPTLTNAGVLADLSDLRVVVDRLRDPEEIRRSRLHPLAVLFAQKTYAMGRSFRGTGTWKPVGPVVDALNDAFYLAFGNVEPANKRFGLFLDVSGSMGCPMADTSLTCRDASAAMALVTAKTELGYHVAGFTSGVRGEWVSKSTGRRSYYGRGIAPLNITPQQRLDDAVRAVSGLPFGGTDCALPMLYALENRMEIDTFVIYTDSETWAGGIHPHEALEQYRTKMGIPARLVVVGMVSNGFTIANPKDNGMLDVVGFDTATPNIISSFARGEF